MDNERKIAGFARPTFGAGWLVPPLVAIVLHMILDRFDTSTEITPAHEDVLNACFALGGLGALLLSSVAIFGRQEMKLWQRVGLAVALAIAGFLSVFLLSSRIAEIVEHYIDFPKKSTQTFSTFLLIDRAYRTQGKGQSWNIQTMPIWSNLDIAEDDYSFMLAHRRPGDDGHNDNKISSKGYFCAHVTVQISGKALQVLNAGSGRLPKGTVVACPASNNPPAHD